MGEIMDSTVILKQRSQIELRVTHDGYVVIREITAACDEYQVGFPVEDIDAVINALLGVKDAGIPLGDE